LDKLIRSTIFVTVGIGLELLQVILRTYKSKNRVYELPSKKNSIMIDK